MTDIEADMLAEELYEYGQLKQVLQKADAIVALGNMDLRLATRAAELYRDGLASTVVASGGVGRLTPKEWTKPEAVFFAEELYRCGVPNDKVIIEEKSTNLPENIRLSLESLNKAKLKSEHLILVALPFAERRIMRLCQKQFPGVITQIASPNISYQAYANEAISREELIALIIGEIDRLDKFPSKGFSVPEHIPGTVLEAMNKLMNAGFDKYRVA
jgi:uncharacterized SAM-binding protein YcdF (DUF218 family)